MGSKQSGSGRHVHVCGGSCCWVLRGFLPTAAVRANSAGVVVAVGASFGFFLRGAGSRAHEALVRVPLALVPALLAVETLPRAPF
jgi:hypothetical protein